MDENELIAGLIGAVVGAVTAYGLGWLQSRWDRTQRRRAVARALYEEQRHAMELFENGTQQGDVAARAFASSMRLHTHDHIAAHVETLQPETIGAVQRFFVMFRTFSTAYGPTVSPYDGAWLTSDPLLMGSVMLEASKESRAALQKELT